APRAAGHRHQTARQGARGRARDRRRHRPRRPTDGAGARRGGDRRRGGLVARGGRVKLVTGEGYLCASDGREEVQRRAMLTFVVGGETYGFPIEYVREIIKMREVTEVPLMPPFVLGVISVRGMVIPVLDLRKRMRLDDTPLTRA